MHGRSGTLRVWVLAGVLVAVAWPASAVAQDTGGVGSVSGTVVSAAGAPELAVTVCLAGTTRCALTDERGHFRLSDVRPGQYEIELTPPGRPRVPGPKVEVRAGLDTVVALTLPAPTEVRENVTVTMSAFVPLEEVKTSGFLLQRQEILSSAGALQDVSRYVQSLPGVALGAVDFRNDLIVRGGSPLENLFIVDNVEIPNINAFANFSSAGGTVSLIDAQLIDNVTFLTGGYPAVYGNRVSSVMQVAQREGERTGFRGRATVGFAGSGGVFEGPLAGGRGSWIVSARRSFLDVFTDDIGAGGVPVLYTLNGKILFDVSARDRVWAVSVSGKDSIRLGLTDESDIEEPVSDFDIRYRGWRSANGFNWQRLFSRGVGLLGVTYSVASVDSQVKDLIKNGIPPAGLPADAVIAAGPVVFTEGSRETETTVKYDLTLEVPVLDKLQVGGGVKSVNLDYDTSAPLGVDSPYSSTPGLNAFALDDRFRTSLIGGYAQATTDVTARLNVTWGARVDRFTYLDETRVGPRAGFSLRLTDRLSWRGSAGRYYQQTPFLFLAAFPENARLDPLRADHFVTGVAFEATPTTRASVEVYRKNYGDYPVSSQWPSLSLANVGDTFNVREVLFPMVSAGRGEAAGVELLLEKKPGGRWYGQANLSISRARHAGLDGVLRPGSYDFPVIVNMDGGVLVTRGWLLTGRLSWLSGRPYTPYDAAASGAAGYGLYDLARVNGERAPDYFRLDLRAERTFRTGQTELLVFGGVQNVTDRRNFAGYYWDRRREEVRFQEQMGIYPILGLEWRFK
jgi:hypothetical protein